MSANFIIEYAGAPVRVNGGGTIELVGEHLATPYASEADAWWGAFKLGLNENRVRVVNTHSRDTSPRPSPHRSPARDAEREETPAPATN